MSGERICSLIASPRRDGNSSLMARAFAEGAAAAGHEVETLHIDDYVTAFLRDCRECRTADGECGIEDRYAELLLEHMLPASAIAIASPIYWYGLPARFKCVVDRLVCYTSHRHRRSEEVLQRLRGKKYALLLSSEESNQGMSVGIVQQMSDFCRYTHGTLVTVVNAVGNRRGEVARDPAQPLELARRTGAVLLQARATDFRIDTSRSGTVWSGGETG